MPIRSRAVVLMAVVIAGRKAPRESDPTTARQGIRDLFRRDFEAQRPVDLRGQWM